MWRFLGAGPLLGLALSLEGVAAGADEPPVALAPVDAPAPLETPAPSSPLAREPTGDVSVISAPRSNAQVKEASDLVQQAPGVVVHDTSGLGQAKELSFRGAAPTGVLVFLDGIPLNGPGGIADLSLVPAAALERVEVLRGAGSLFGSGGLGGVVNLVTREPRSGRHLLAEVTAGSFGSELAQVSASGTLPGGSGLLLVDGLHTDGDFTYLYNPRAPLDVPPLTATRANNAATLGEALAKYRASLGPWTARVTVEGAVDQRGLPGSVLAPTPKDRQSTDRGAAGVQLTRELGPGAGVTVHGFFRRDDDRFTGQEALGGTFTQGQTSAGAEAQAWALLGIHGLTGAASAGGEWLRSTGGYLDNAASQSPSWARLSALAMDELMLWGGLASLVPAVRLDEVGPFFGVSPKLGARLDLPAHLSLRANGGQAFRAPSFLELYVVQGRLLPNPQLRPERTLSSDLQLGYQGPWASAAVGGFYNESENLIVYQSYVGGFSRPVNFLTASEAGGELEAQAAPWAWLRVSGKYTYLRSEILRGTPDILGRQLPNHPQHTAWARLTAGPAWLSGHLELLYQSDQFTNASDRRSAIAAYSVLNAGASLEVPRVRGLSVSLEVKDILDTQTEDLEHYPLPRRAFYATVRFSLDSPAPSGDRLPFKEG